MNLPPGVASSMIPGNTPEDAAWESFVETFATFLETFGIDYGKLSDRELETFDRLTLDAWTFILANVPEVG